MRDRQQQILEYVIEMYVKAAEPVSSFDLLEEYDLPYSSATIRNELLALEKEGFLFQPYTSAGRVPTDQGYRYYVNQMKEKETLLTEYARYTSSLLDSLDTMKEINMKLKLLLLKMAEYSGNVALGKTEGEIIFEEGVNKFLNQPYFNNLAFVREALETLEDAKNRIDDIANLTTAGKYRLYIGEENPIRSLQNYSVIVGKCVIDDSEGTIVMIGPKGMEYQKNIALIEHLLENSED